MYSRYTITWCKPQAVLINKVLSLGGALRRSRSGERSAKTAATASFADSPTFLPRQNNFDSKLTTTITSRRHPTDSRYKVPSPHFYKNQPDTLPFKLARHASHVHPRPPGQACLYPQEGCRRRGHQVRTSCQILARRQVLQVRVFPVPTA